MLQPTQTESVFFCFYVTKTGALPIEATLTQIFGYSFYVWLLIFGTEIGIYRVGILFFLKLSVFWAGLA
jgi:hypothetical protein